jgi:hypothetical protein
LKHARNASRALPSGATQPQAGVCEARLRSRRGEPRRLGGSGEQSAELPTSLVRLTRRGAWLSAASCIRAAAPLTDDGPVSFSSAPGAAVLDVPARCCVPCAQATFPAVAARCMRACMPARQQVRQGSSAAPSTPPVAPWARLDGHASAALAPVPLLPARLATSSRASAARGAPASCPRLAFFQSERCCRTGRTHARRQRTAVTHASTPAAHTMEAASPIGAPLGRRRLSSHPSLSSVSLRLTLAPVWRLRGDPAGWRLRSSVLRARLGCKSKERLDRAPPTLLRRIAAAAAAAASCLARDVRLESRPRRDPGGAAAVLARARMQGQGCSAETGEQPAPGRRLGLFSVQHAAVAAPACRVVLPRWRGAARCESRKVRQRRKSSAAGWLLVSQAGCRTALLPKRVARR